MGSMIRRISSGSWIAWRPNPGLDFSWAAASRIAARIPPKRWRTNALGTWTLGRIAGVKWEDSQSGFRMVKKKVLDRMDIRGQGFTFEMETAMKAARRTSIRWAHVPIQAIYHEVGGGSHFRGSWTLGSSPGSRSSAELAPSVPLRARRGRGPGASWARGPR